MIFYLAQYNFFWIYFAKYTLQFSKLIVSLQQLYKIADKNLLKNNRIQLWRKHSIAPMII
jgi:hypothetical protein